jgi:hypothetical protein
MSGVRIALSWSEVVVAAFSGLQRHVECLQQGRTPMYGLGRDEQTWDHNINGAITEAAYAKAFDHYPKRDAAPDTEGDLRNGTEIRGTMHADGCLILHDRDHDDRPYVLVTGRPPEFIVRGWLYGREGKQPAYWRADWRRPCYAVPQAALRPIEDLVAW